MGRCKPNFKQCLKRNKRSIAAQKRVKTTNNKKFISEILSDVLERVEREKQSAVDCSIILNELVDNVMENVQKVSLPSPNCIELVPLDEYEKQSFTQEVPSTSAITKESDKNFENDYDFEWGSLDEYGRVMTHQLDVEVEEFKEIINGNRIVNINYLLNQTIRLQSQHSQYCTGSMLELWKEKKRGLVSTFLFRCNMCSKILPVHSEKPNQNLNKAAVWGTLCTGSTFEHTAEFLSVLDVPPISKTMFFNIQSKLGNIWKDCLWEAMAAAAKEEYDIALSKGHVDELGIASITVIIDGGWSKRSYGHSFNALSGVAVIIGKETGKLLFLGVKNKFCSICAKAENKGESVKEHICYKNWTKSSSSMEPAILVEGVNASIPSYKLKYKRFVGDGDSTVFSEIRKKVDYGLEVEKIECTNHCLKNYSKGLYKIKSDTKNISLQARKLITRETIQSLVSAAQNAIYANAHGDLESLKSDIRNSIKHVYGNHEDCKDYLCDNVGDKSLDRTEELVRTGAHHHLYATVNLLLTKCHLLIDKETSNRAELYMSLLSRFNMGKRLNLVQRDAFQSRSYLSGLKFNDGHLWHAKAWKKTFHKSPGKNLKHYMAKKEEEKLKKKRSQIEKPECRTRKRLKYNENSCKESKAYGPDIAEIFLNSESLDQEVTKLLQRLQITQEEIIRISMETVGQFENPLYMSERQHRLTASNFGAVVRRMEHTPCDSLVKTILSTSSVHTAATAYGKKNEIVAIRKFSEITGKQVEPCGLYIYDRNGFLAASPDGITDDGNLIEVKCLYKVATSKQNLLESVDRKEVGCLEINKETKNIQLKKTHGYFYQIQGQLSICNKSKCYFVVYSGDHNELFIEEIWRDDELWHNVMLPKLSKFYRHCVAPEIILNRRHKGLKCQDPQYIMEAQEAKKNKKK